MSKLKKLKKFAGYYGEANRARTQHSSGKWRILVVLLLISTILVVKDYLSDKYIAEFAENPIAYLVLDKVLYWFVSGIMVGIAFSWLMFEGEFMIAVWRIGKQLEGNAIRGLEKAAGVKSARRAPARRKKR
ncbi:hypothetical protein AUJ14_02500 [Candidatus Micrarchaeota archaeon CG1_02_55_22]|nr:MAG: hypothetical protein AUJ14_02500 [Candidatus Micrarchaeota archaeon CG1_02_55_22]